MGYLLDTSFLIGIIREESNALKIFETLLNNDSDFFTCPISITQILSKVRKNENFLKIRIFLFFFQVINVNSEISFKAGQLGYDLARKCITIPDTDDLIINILCQENDLTLITSNLKHFPNKNIKILEYKY